MKKTLWWKSCIMKYSFSLYIVFTYVFYDEVSARCPEGWLMNACSCYQRSNTIENWPTARKKCEDLDSHLVTIHSSSEESFVATQVAKGKDVYIGLHDQHEENDFKWIDDSAVGYTNWHKGEPNNGPENCGLILKASGKWADQRCHFTYPFACKTPAKDGRCLHSWSYDGVGQCFVVSNRTMTWTNAKQICQIDMGGLASINNEEENKFLQSLLTKDGTWIGLTDEQHEGHWVWGDISQNLSYTNWNKNEPNGGEDCVILRISVMNWNDIPCYRKHHYICEKPIETPSIDELSIRVGVNVADVSVVLSEQTNTDCFLIKVKTQKLENDTDVACGTEYRTVSNPRVQYNDQARPNIPLKTSFELGALEPCTAYNVSLITSINQDEHVMQSAIIVTSKAGQCQNYTFDNNVKEECDDNTTASLVWWCVVLLSIFLFIIGFGTGHLFRRSNPFFKIV